MAVVPRAPRRARSRPPGDAALDRFMACRLLPRRPPPAPAPQSVPEGLWEGTLQMGLQPPEPVPPPWSAAGARGSARIDEA